MTGVGARWLADLRARVGGEVGTDRGTLAAYSADASNHRVLPAAVVFPRSRADVAAVVRGCAAEGVPVTSRGAGTGVAGAALGEGVVLDHSRHLTGVLALDPEAGTAVVQPGVVLDRLQSAAAPHGLRFGPDPSTHDRCTLGGMVGTNACGAHSVLWGTTADNVLDVELMDAAGETAWASSGRYDAALSALREQYLAVLRTELGRFARQGSGYGLHHLLPERGFSVARALTGAEGTCGVVTAVRVRLVAPPPQRALVVLGFATEARAAEAAPALLPARPMTVEGIDDRLVRTFDARPGPHRRPELPPGSAWLLVEVGGSGPQEVRERARRVVDAAGDPAGWDLLTDPGAQRAVWAVRERGAGLATRTVDGAEAWPGFEDAAVPPERLAGYLRDFRALLAEHGRDGVVYGHFGEGCVHVRVDHDLLTGAGRAAYRRFQADAADLVVAHQGSLSGEHGDGRSRSALLDRMYSADALAAFAAFKHVFDPGRVFNPGVLVDPVPLDADLRLALHRTGPRVDLAFGYADDGGSIAKAARRCVGVGACRRDGGGGMCPSYRATRDERHSTRGRARLLFEMLQGSLADDGWRSEEVRGALDLCLACKACASECPVSVDMATYKAEFLHQHYRRRPRPRSHYALGWLPVWLRLARGAPGLANRVLAGPLPARLGGLDPGRPLPRLAAGPTPSRRSGPADGRPVTLWLDTFTAAFDPSAAEDARTLLAAAGHHVSVVGPEVCCGLTWVTTGQLGRAATVMRRAVTALAGGDGPVVVLEPSCAATLRGDLPGLLGTPAARGVARRVRTLAEVLVHADLPLAATTGDLVAQFHCHQRAVFGTAADQRLLSRLGLTVTSVEEGCCGLAGSFGLERGHEGVSRACAEQSFLPVLADHPDAVVVADGFSCRLQVGQLSGRPAMPLARLLAGRLRTPSP